MRHGNFMPIFYGEWVIIIFLGGMLLLIVGIIWFLHNRNIASDGLTPVERKGLPFPEREILSLLRQNGGPVKQNEMLEELPGDLEDLAEVVKTMETKGLLHRKWESESGTYIISAHA